MIFAAFPLILPETLPPETVPDKVVADNVPVEGLKDNLVVDTLDPVTVPLVIDVKSG